jgi:hypothetical protein
MAEMSDKKMEGMVLIFVTGTGQVLDLYCMGIGDLNTCTTGLPARL